MSIWTRIAGGWKTWGPGAILTAGGFDSPKDSIYDAVTVDAAMKLSAFFACVNLRAETLASLPLHLRDAKKNIIRDHDLYSVLHDSPNAMQTASEYWSMQNAHVDVYGNGLSIIKRRSNKSVISLEPIMEPNLASLVPAKKSGGWKYVIDGEDYGPEDVLHLRGFTMDGLWGMPRLEVGRHIIAAQIRANDSAARAFRQALKLPGFFEITEKGQNLTAEQRADWKKILDEHGKPENEGKFLTLLKGLKPVGGAEFRIKPSDAELLQSRYFGVEEICRLCAVPPQLVGHSDKASSWASSLENINLHFLMYSLQPTFVRNEGRIRKSLLSPQDRAVGVEAKHSIQGLLRSDMKTQMEFFASALQNRYYNRNEVRDLLDRPGIGPEGDQYDGTHPNTGGDPNKQPQQQGK